MKISSVIHNFWREVEDIMTAATGPVLIVASAIAAADIFSNHVFSAQFTWIPAAWALARALAVTAWLAIAFDFYLRARAQGGGGWWLLLSLALFAVDLQTALLFAIEDEHIAAVGTIPLVTIPAMYWAFEQAILGVVLIAVHRAIDHQTHSLEIARAVTIPAALRPEPQEPTVVASAVARRAYWDGPATGMLELVSDEEAGREPTEQREHLTRQTPRKASAKGATGDGRKRRRDSGRQSGDKERRIQRLVAQLRRDPNMTIEDVADYLDVSRGTAVTDRAEAKRRLREDM